MTVVREECAVHPHGGRAFVAAVEPCRELVLTAGPDSYPPRGQLIAGSRAMNAGIRSVAGTRRSAPTNPPSSRRGVRRWNGCRCWTSSPGSCVGPERRQDCRGAEQLFGLARSGGGTVPATAAGGLHAGDAGATPPPGRDGRASPRCTSPTPPPGAAAHLAYLALHRTRTPTTREAKASATGVRGCFVAANPISPLATSMSVTGQDARPLKGRGVCCIGQAEGRRRRSSSRMSRTATKAGARPITRTT
jgi:hypothetical protein